MFEIQKDDGTWEKLNASIHQMGSDHFEVTVSWAGMVLGNASMFDGRTCRLNGTTCRQVIGSSYKMDIPGGTTLVLQVTI